MRKLFTDIVQRVKRFISHLIYPIYQVKDHLKVTSIIGWFMDLIFYIIDLLFLPEIYLLMVSIFKPSMRKLTVYELQLAESVYGDKLNYGNVFIDDNTSLFTEKYKFAYVSFNLINYTGHLQDFILIHELMHVYQYQRFGSVYIYRALKVQVAKGDPYNYGGTEGLIQAYRDKKTLFDFNFEQQASIIEHFFILKNRIEVIDMENILDVYSHYYNQL
jgi:hypothetical protein